MQGVRLVRVLLPAALGRCAVLLFLLQPLMVLGVLQGVRQRAQGFRQVPAPSDLAICKATPSPIQFPKGLPSPRGPPLASWAPTDGIARVVHLVATPASPTHPAYSSPWGRTNGEAQSLSSNTDRTDFTPTLSLAAIWLWANRSLL